MRRTMGLVMASVMAVTLLAGCGGNKAAEPATTAAPAATTAAADAEKASEESKADATEAAGGEL